MGYDLIAVARSRDKLEALKQELNTEVQVLPLDLSRERACFDLYNQVKDQNIDVLINNAGYGMYGRFYDTDLEQELNMLPVSYTHLDVYKRQDPVGGDRGNQPHGD